MWSFIYESWVACAYCCLRKRCLSLNSMELTDANLGRWCFIYHFLGSSIHWKYFLYQCWLFLLLCHLLRCPSVSDRQCAMQAALKTPRGKWKDGNALNWSHGWGQHACKLQPQLWGIPYSVGGVERQRCVAYFVFFFSFLLLLSFVIEVAKFSLVCLCFSHVTQKSSV